MSVFLILFLISITGLLILIGRKMLVMRQGDLHIPANFDFSIEVPDFEEVREVVIKKSRRYGYIMLVITIRLYVLSAHTIKQQSKSIISKIKSRIPASHKTLNDKKENKFLKKVSDYKQKISHLKSKIKEEEGLN